MLNAFVIYTKYVAIFFNLYILGMDLSSTEIK